MNKNKNLGQKNLLKKPVRCTKKRGFSMMETLVAVSIFALVSVLLAGIFSGFLKNSLRAKKIQRSTESARYAMDLMAKTLRTSSVVGIDNVNRKLKIFDFSQSSGNNCIEYGYNPTRKVVMVDTSSAIDVAGCSTATFSAPMDLTPVDATGSGGIESVSFLGQASTSAALGKITMVINVAGDDPANPVINSTKIQTTVSLRQ